MHQSPERVTSIRLQQQKISGISAVFPQLDTTPVPWTSGGYYLSSRPSFTFDPLFHAGTYYVQEASSMFLEEAIRQTTDTGAPIRALDLCAAPGGKSTLIQGAIHPDSVLVANEVIKTRAALLADNITKWGAANVVVTNNDPRDFTRLPAYFDLMIVDAPCSGSGLFRRDPEAVEEWSQDNVILCSQRQQRILADALPALKPGGVLIYSTCSYAVEEDEEIMDWLMEHFEMENIPLQLRPEWHIVETASVGHKAMGYRFYPDQVRGEGFFIACFRKLGGPAQPPKIKAGFSSLPRKEAELVRPWLQNAEEMALMAHKGEAMALSIPLAKEIALIQKQLYIRKAGVKAGQLTPRELVPDHQLAVSTCIADNLPAAELSLEQALRYLRKEEFTPEGAAKGWNLMRFNGKNLGWAKVLPNRINNYYPKELRILKAGMPDL